MLIKKCADLIIGVENNYTDLKCKDNIICADLRNKLRNGNVFTNFGYHENELFLNAFRIYSNLHTLIFFNKDKNSIFNDFYKTRFKDNYILYGIKEVELTKNNVIKALYQLLYFRHKCKNINSYLNYINKYIENFNNFLDLNENDNIKISLLIIIPRNSNINFYNLKEEVNEDYLLYIPKNDNERWISASLFFNQNSLDFLEKQDFKFYLKNDNEKYWEKMDEFIDLINNIQSIEDKHRTLFYSSTILYFLGHRANNDFDFMIFCKDNDDNFHNLFREIENNKNSPEYIKKYGKGCYDFSYINTNDLQLKRAYYEEFYDKWAQNCNLTKWEEIYAFGKNHMYYLGIKSTTLNQDIMRRIMRNRPRSIADLIALRKRYGFKINIPKPPKSIDKFYKVNELSLEEKCKLLSNNGILINTYGIEEIKVVENIDQNKFVDTIIWALKERYNMDFTISEVLIELNIEKNDIIKNTYKIRIKKEEEKSKEKIKIIKTKDAVSGTIKTQNVKISKTNSSKIVIK